MKSIKTRCSVRVFEDKPILDSDVEKILRAGFCAPSACNYQPWQFVVVKEKTRLLKLATTSPYATPLETAVCAIVVLADLSCNPSLDYCQQDCAAATQNMLIQANKLGIGSCWLGGYPNQDRVEAIRSILSVPEGIVPLWTIALGYPDQKLNIQDKWKPEKIHRESYAHHKD